MHLYVEVTVKKLRKLAIVYILHLHADSYTRTVTQRNDQKIRQLLPRGFVLSQSSFHLVDYDSRI